MCKHYCSTDYAKKKNNKSSRPGAADTPFYVQINQNGTNICVPTFDIKYFFFYFFLAKEFSDRKQ